MAVKPGKAAQGKAIHHNKPSSKMAHQKGVTKPENRHPLTHNYSVSSADSQIRKLG